MARVGPRRKKKKSVKTVAYTRLRAPAGSRYR